VKKDQASWTAEISATLRAVESIRPHRERLLQDIYAASFLRPSIRFLLKNRFLTDFALWFFIDRRFPGASVTNVTRVRFVDDVLKRGIAAGVRQVIILGAGYDSRAYRFPELKKITVFEVDHPNTQALKKNKISAMFGNLPRHVVYVPVDFEKDPLMLLLTQNGYRQDLKTLFIWEGVCKYLTAEAVDRLLTLVSTTACKGSAIVFDYLFQSIIDGSTGSELINKMLRFQARKGEPFIFGLPEKAVEQFILSRGFSQANNVTAAKLKEIYFNLNKRGRQLHSFWGMMEATI